MMKTVRLTNDRCMGQGDMFNLSVLIYLSLSRTFNHMSHPSNCLSVNVSNDEKKLM